MLHDIGCGGALAVAEGLVAFAIDPGIVENRRPAAAVRGGSGVEGIEVAVAADALFQKGLNGGRELPADGERNGICQYSPRILRYLRCEEVASF